MLLALELVIPDIGPVHAHELVVARDYNIFWDFSKLFDIVYWVSNFKSSSHLWSIKLCCQILIGIVLEGESETVHRLPLPVHISLNVWNYWDKWRNTDHFGST